jgi:FAD/FMN-containing dehydrogenase
MQPAAAPSRAIETLLASVRGQIVRPEDPSYDDVRRIHNGMIDRKPGLIVRCTGAADVQQCVRVAREHGLLVSIRGGGHSVPGFAVCEGGMMIDLSTAKGVRVDGERRTARAQGGATWGDFDHETHAYGLATTGGVMGTTGIAGLTLAGGHGLLMRKYGLACDNLLSVDVVTADGRLITASKQENDDLFWGLRGGGGNFGIVTSFQFQLHPVSTVLGGLLIYPLDHARGILRAYDDYTATAPDELGCAAVLGTLPDGTKIVGILLAWCGSPESGEEVMKTLRSFGPLLADQVTVMPYPAVQSIAANFNPRGMRNYWKTSYLPGVSAEAIEIMLDFHKRSTAPFTHQVIYTLGGAGGRVGKDETAVSYRDSRHAFVGIGMWDDPARDEAEIAHQRDLWSALQPFSSGGFYPNYEGEAAAGQLREAFGPANYDRLLALKRKYDPDNFFRLNQNINPAA